MPLIAVNDIWRQPAFYVQYSFYVFCHQTWPIYSSVSKQGPGTWKLWIRDTPPLLVKNFRGRRSSNERKANYRSNCRFICYFHLLGSKITHFTLVHKIKRFRKQIKSKSITNLWSSKCFWLFILVKILKQRNKAFEEKRFRFCWSTIIKVTFTHKIKFKTNCFKHCPRQWSVIVLLVFLFYLCYW